MTIAYQIKDKLYLNITNRCPCDCVFCVRHEKDSMDGENSLWLEREPEFKEVIESINKRDLSVYREIVFCGYGEPTENLDVLLLVGEYLKERYPKLPVRLNTNGLSDLINGRETAPLFENIIDEVSISLNAPSAKQYGEITRPSFDAEQAFACMLKFASECRKYIKTVVFSVVDLLDEKEIDKCKALAKSLDIPLRIREKI